MTEYDASRERKVSTGGVVESLKQGRRQVSLKEILGNAGSAEISIRIASCANNRRKRLRI